VKSPEYQDGTLICPYCHMPLIGYEETYLTIKCSICKNAVGKVSIEILKKMFDDIPASLLKEWKTEMKNMTK